MPQSQRSNEFGEVVSWFVSKFGAFLSNEMMRNIIGQTKSAFTLREVMDEGKILIVNLSKGRLGMLNSQLLGMIFVMKFQAAAMGRANVPENERRDFALYVDEFQNFSTDSFASILSEARKYHLNLIVANQFTTQLTDEIRDAVFGNTGTIVAFRVGQDEDADALAKRMRPAFDAPDLLRMPNYNAAVRMLINGVPTQPFSMATLPPLGSPNMKLVDALKQLSAAKYGRPKAVVEKEIWARLATQEPAAPAAVARPFGGGASASSFGNVGAVAPGGFGAPAPGAQPFAAGGPASPQQPVPGTGSFLDEWFAKRESKGPLLRPNPWANSSASPQGAAAQPAAPAGVAPADLPATHVSASPLPAPAAARPQSAVGTQNTPMVPSEAIPEQPGPTAMPKPQTPSQQLPEPAADNEHEVAVAADEAVKKLTGLPVAAPALSPSLPKTNPLPTEKPKDALSGEIPLLKEQQAEGADTIFIDQEGNLHLRS
ncbi:MAG TPA: type IV secretory system conjugative DNA transfer family protein, partial [Candidatus Saccharimonadales bacterium]